MAGLTFKGKKCCVGKKGGVYLHTKKGGRKYLSKSEKKQVRKGGKLVSAKQLKKMGNSNTGRHKVLLDKLFQIKLSK